MPEHEIIREVAQEVTTSGSVGAVWIALASAGGIALGAIATAIVSIYTAFKVQKRQDAKDLGESKARESESKSKERKDSAEEWQVIVERLQKDQLDQKTEHKAEVDDLRKQIKGLYDENSECRKESGKQQVQLAEQKGELRLLQITVQRLQGLHGDTAPATTLPALVIAGLDGIICEATPAIAPLLHWMPADLEGQSVELLIPERYIEAHRAGMKRIADTGTPPWTDRIVSGYGLAKDGAEVPVAVTLSAWKTAKGEWLISAEVRQRVITGKTALKAKDPNRETDINMQAMP